MGASNKKPEYLNSEKIRIARENQENFKEFKVIAAEGVKTFYNICLSNKVNGIVKDGELPTYAEIIDFYKKNLSATNKSDLMNIILKKINFNKISKSSITLKERGEKGFEELRDYTVLLNRMLVKYTSCPYMFVLFSVIKLFHIGENVLEQCLNNIDNLIHTIFLCYHTHITGKPMSLNDKFVIVESF